MLGLALTLALGLPVVAAEAQVKPPVQRTLPGMKPVTKLERPAPARPSLARFEQLYVQSKGDVTRLRELLVAERVNAKVQRLCYVPGRFNQPVVCRPLGEIMQKELGRGPADRAFLSFGFNDIWEQMGGDPAGGDLLSCGGASAGAMTNVQPFASPRAAQGKSGWTTPAAPQAQAMTDSCRNAQKASISAGLGALYVPGSEGYRRAVGNAQGFLASVGESCNAPVSGGLGREQISTGGQAKLTGGEAANVVASTTKNIVDGAETAANLGANCAKGKTSCAVAVTGAVTAVVGIAATGDQLTSEQNETLQMASTAGDIVGGVIAFGTTSASATGFATVMPVASAAFAGFALGSVIEQGLDSTLDPLRVNLADAIWEAQYGSSQGTAPSPSGIRKGTMRPGEGGKPSCEEMAARAARFNAYCSQPGNNWQSYDCMLFVARLNGCADPGVIRPAPGEDFQCSPRTTMGDEHRLQLACQQSDKLRGLLGNPGTPGGNTGRCEPIGVSRSDLDRRMREGICTRALTDDPNGFCDPMRR